MREDKEGSGLLIEAARYPTLYSSRAAQRRVQRRPNFQTGIANFRIRPRRSATETRPAKSRKIGGNARRARIQSSGASLRECYPERARNTSRPTHSGLGCRTHGGGRGRAEVYATFPLGGAQLAGCCRSPFCPRRLHNSVSKFARELTQSRGTW